VNGVRPVYTSTDLYPQPRNGCVQRPKLSSSDDLFAKKGPSTGMNFMNVIVSLAVIAAVAYADVQEDAVEAKWEGPNAA